MEAEISSILVLWVELQNAYTSHNTAQYHLVIRPSLPLSNSRQHHQHSFVSLYMPAPQTTADIITDKWLTILSKKNKSFVWSFQLSWQSPRTPAGISSRTSKVTRNTGNWIQMQTTEAELVQYNNLFKHTKKVRSLRNSEAGKGQNQGRQFKQV